MLPPFYNVNHVLVNQQTAPTVKLGFIILHHLRPCPWRDHGKGQRAGKTRHCSVLDLVCLVWIQCLGKTCSYYSISQQERSVWWEDRRGALAWRKQGRRDMPRAWHKVHCAAQFMPHRLCSIMLRWSLAKL